jgi:hypothetical protein
MIAKITAGISDHKVEATSTPKVTQNPLRNGAYLGDWGGWDWGWLGGGWLGLDTFTLLTEWATAPGRMA